MAMARLALAYLLLIGYVVDGGRFRAKRSAPPTEEFENRLSPDCKEPKNPARAADGEGPEEVYCCHTAKSKLEHLDKRNKDCEDTVPCHDSWKELLPAYVDYYQGLKDTLCRTTTTTTTTTTTVTTVTATTEEEKEEEPEETTTTEEPKTTTPYDPLQCMKSCLELATEDEAKCKALCDVLTARYEEAGCKGAEIAEKEEKEAAKQAKEEGKKEGKDEQKKADEADVKDAEEAVQEEEQAEEAPAEEETPAEEEAPAEDAEAEEPAEDASAESADDAEAAEAE